MHDLLNFNHITFQVGMQTMNESAAELQAERDAEEQHNTWESEKDEAAMLGMTVVELRAEKELIKIQQDELDTYQNRKEGIY